MKTLNYTLTTATTDAASRIPSGCVNEQSHRIGTERGEPIIIMLDSLVRYAVAYEKRFEQKLAEGGVLGDPWLQAAKGVRALLNGDGAVAMEMGRSTDSKDNSACESVFWAALEAAGYTEADI